MYSTCIIPCGNGLKVAADGEQCDDSNTGNDDGCSSTCQIEIAKWTCITVENVLSVCDGICGDGFRVGNETCDDGTDTDGDGCKVGCKTGAEPGWTCTGGTLTTKDDCVSTCNDGIVVTGENCDDGDLDNLDGCSSACLQEVGWSCVAPFPS
jgi:cysteine-rich repeat protein